jgi:uncharacterized phage protein (TIGR01671 family)
MREIKFRVWSNQLNKMVYPNERGWFDKCFIGKNQFIQSCQLSLAIEKNGKELEVMQYTGLKDRNGTEIYEGDILLVISEIYTNFGKIPTGKFSKEYCEVIWKDDGWGYKVLRSDHTIEGTEIKGLKVTTKYAEVIGNIFQDGDLLDSEISKVDRDCKRG